MMGKNRAISAAVVNPECDGWREAPPQVASCVCMGTPSSAAQPRPPPSCSARSPNSPTTALSLCLQWHQGSQDSPHTITVSVEGRDTAGRGSARAVLGL